MFEFDEVARAQRWTAEQQVEILMQYIVNQQSDDVFLDFVGEQVALDDKAPPGIRTIVFDEAGPHDLGSLDVGALHNVIAGAVGEFGVETERQLAEATIAYAFEPHWFRKLELVAKGLHGDGSALTSDQRRDLANLLTLTLGNAVQLKAGDTV